MFIYAFLHTKQERKNRGKKFLGKVTCLFLYDITGGGGYIFAHFLINKHY